jgi:hypothetical protein
VRTILGRVTRAPSRRLAHARGDAVHHRPRPVLGDDEGRRELEGDAAENVRDYAVAAGAEDGGERSAGVGREELLVELDRGGEPDAPHLGDAVQLAQRLEQVAQDRLERAPAHDSRERAADASRTDHEKTRGREYLADSARPSR